jgi:hypothetical protein
MENNTSVLIIGIIGAIISPIITALGLYFQYQKDKRTAVSEQVKAEAEADKVLAEAKALDAKANMDTVNYYIGMVNALRTEVNNLTELSRKNGGEISILMAKLAQADSEKAQLARDNAALVQEVKELRAEVAILKQQQKEK